MASAPPSSAAVARWYGEKVRRYGYACRGLGWQRRSSQRKRFEALGALGPFHRRSLLDAGCGFADLLAHLHARGVRPFYTGLDLCPAMIGRCRERFPDGGARFFTGDVLGWRPAAPFDYVVASGLFGLGVDGAADRGIPRGSAASGAMGAAGRVGAALDRLFSWCRLGLAVNFLSARSPRQVRGRLYLEPEALLARALALTPAVRLDHGYLPNDFTLHLYRRPPWEATS